MEGYSSKGNVLIINAPASIITSEITIASLGLSMNKFDFLFSDI